MDSLEQFLADEGRDKFQEAVKINDIECQNDPETEPYKSKYKAREIWHDLRCKVEEIIGECQPGNLACKVPLAVLLIKLGMNYAETEEVKTGEENFARCIDMLEDHRLDEVACNVLQHAYNQMGILWVDRKDLERGLAFLQSSEALYKDYKSKAGGAPYSMEECFALKGEDEDEGSVAHRRVVKFEDTYTHTLYFLAQVYSKLNETKKSSQYCHVTLRRQLESKTYNAQEWAMNAAMLSQYYITQCNFNLARHCLSSASIILMECGEPVTKCQYRPEETEAEATERERLPRAWSDLYRCWAKYGLAVLEGSWEKMLEAVEAMDEEQSHKDGEDHNADKKPDIATATPAAQEELAASSSEASGQQVSKDDTKLRFELELTSTEDQITDQFVKDFGQARKVFLTVQKWLNAAKEFYVLEGHCTDHVEIVQDHSRLFKLLANFEPDFDRQCKMHKRRVDMLQSLSKELSLQHYLMICRQLMYEIAETYSAILDIKLSIIEEHGTPPSQHAVNKINLLTQQSIEWYQTYLDTLKTADKTMPDKFSEDDERPALIAFFCMGRLYSKFLQFEVNRHLVNMKQSIDHYKFLVDYCKQNPSALDKVKTERDICEEMVTLLPVKMERIRNQAE